MESSPLITESSLQITQRDSVALHSESCWRKNQKLIAALFSCVTIASIVLVILGATGTFTPNTNPCLRNLTGLANRDYLCSKLDNGTCHFAPAEWDDKTPFISASSANIGTINLFSYVFNGTETKYCSGPFLCLVNVQCDTFENDTLQIQPVTAQFWLNGKYLNHMDFTCNSNMNSSTWKQSNKEFEEIGTQIHNFAIVVSFGNISNLPTYLLIGEILSSRCVP
jgi:hypothetical protein